MRIKLTTDAYHRRLLEALYSHPGYEPGMDIAPDGHGWKCRTRPALFSPDDQVVFVEVIESVSTKYYRREALTCRRTEFTDVVDMLNHAFAVSRTITKRTGSPDLFMSP